MTEKTARGDESRPSPVIAPGDLEHMAALILAAGLNILPSATRAKVIYRLSRAAGTIWHKMNRTAVRRVRHHLEFLFDCKETDTQLEYLVRNQLTLSSWNALIANLLPSLREQHLASLCRIEDLHYVDDVRQRNEVVLLLGFHYGVYGYVIAASLVAQGYPAHLVGYGGNRFGPSGTSYFYRKLYQNRVKRLRQRIQVINIRPGEELQPELNRILEQKHSIVYLLADQYFVVPPGQASSSYLVPLRFIGRTVYLDITGVQLAKRMGAQPFTAIPVQEGQRQRVSIQPMEWAGSGTSAVDIAKDLQVYLARLEQHLLENPALWRDLRRPDLLARMGVFDGKEVVNG